MLRSPRNKIVVSSSIDCSNDFSLPLDFCFKHLEKFQDVLKEPPRGKLKKCPETGKYKTNGIKFSYNQLSSYEDLNTVLDSLLVDPKSLEWLDISYNDFTSVDKVILDYPNLKILNLEGNSIEKLSELDKLAALPNLQSITIQGNPIESTQGYKNYILARLPHLKKFNSAPITKQDKAGATLSSRGKQWKGAKHT
ncbi:leucine-rich repeat-containing protein 51-like [Actinia tenebrosa]|uniref:Leucine-rich repeat-containing protein 51 n=1 Tax=Actinia tenebrosa TaxID=6105 RepID=A0A6P8IDF6_ACTTE|nr:leucine-rich repeat-containing protein 51-like [Actinia tenebrosa]